MDFTFSEDQQLSRQAIRDYLCHEITCEHIRKLWKTESGRSEACWQQLAKLGWCGFSVPENYGGMGLNELDFILPAQECGYAALPEPLVQCVLIVTPLLCAFGTNKSIECLKKIATGEKKVAVCLEVDPCIEDAHIADVLILQRGDQLHMIDSNHVSLIANESIDPSRRLFTVEWEAGSQSLVAEGEHARDLIAQTLDRGALASAVMSLGLTQRMIDLSVKYTSEREQFGQAVGAFQAVKHHMANVAVQWAFSKAPVYRAAYALSKKNPLASFYISHAKLAACEAAQLAAKNAIQVHGAMGYTWEMDLHIFMKKSWALNQIWGDRGYHLSRVASQIFNDDAMLHACDSFE